MSDLVRGPSSSMLLARVLEEPGLVAAVQSLPPRALGTLVDRIGLEDAAELVALATTEQVQALLDEDVWDSEGELDARRFLLWLDVMLESGEAVAAQRLAELDEDLLSAAVHRLVHVIDLETIDVGNRRLDRFVERSLGDELGHFQVMARHPDGWDTIFSVLLSLDRDHGELLERVLARCAGKFESDDLVEVDAEASRDDRRAGLGYVSHGDARAFLLAARRDGAGRGRDHVTAQYLAQPVPAQRTPDARLMRLLGEDEPTSALPRLRSGEPEPRFAAAMRALREKSPKLYAERLRELAYLGNVLLAAGEAARPIDAFNRALEVCSRGLELDGRSLECVSADHCFKLGWQRAG